MTSRNLTLKRGVSSLAAFALLAVAFVAVNVLAGVLPARLDVTEEGIYTLSEGSRRIVAGLEEPVTLKYFFTAGEDDIPVTLKTYATKVRELLRQFVSGSGGKVRLEVIDPRPDTDEEEWATRYGLSAGQLPTGGRLIHGLVVLSAGQEAIVPFFDSRREKFLEYDISEAVTRVTREAQEKLGLISFLPMMGQFDPRTRRLVGEWAVIQELRKMFQIEDLLRGDVAEIPADIKLVLVVHPRGLTSQVAYALDQFVVRGGRVIVLADPYSRHDPSNPNMMDTNFSRTLGALFKAWKIKFDQSKIVADLALATRVNTPNQGVVDYPVWISFREGNFNRESVITSQLEQIIMADAGAFEPAEGFENSFTPLLTSSQASGVVDRVTIRMAGALDIGKSLKTDGKARVLAALISGKFDSGFPAGPPPPPPKEDKEGQKGGEEKKIERKLPHLAKGEKETSLLLVGDADFLGDRFAVRAVNFFGQTVFSPLNDNLSFILNAVEFMAGNQDLIHIRSRGQISRPFTRVAELQVSAQQKYREQEKTLSESLAQVRQRLRESESNKPEGQEVILNPEQIQEIQQFRLEEARTRRALREVRKVLRQDIEYLGNTLLVINMLAVPLLVALLGFVAIIRRSKRSGGGIP
jgi:ABC-type uncharacterized transport system involved in gliding motility auxiliary subunit